MYSVSKVRCYIPQTVIVIAAKLSSSQAFVVVMKEKDSKLQGNDPGAGVSVSVPLCRVVPMFVSPWMRASTRPAHCWPHYAVHWAADAVYNLNINP